MKHSFSGAGALVIEVRGFSRAHSIPIHLAEVEPWAYERAWVAHVDVRHADLPCPLQLPTKGWNIGTKKGLGHVMSPCLLIWACNR